LFLRLAVMPPCCGKSESMARLALIPWKFGEQQTHAAKVRNSGEN
jgi:hypothetical protein